MQILHPPKLKPLDIRQRDAIPHIAPASRLERTPARSHGPCPICDGWFLTRSALISHAQCYKVCLDDHPV